MSHPDEYQHYVEELPPSKREKLEKLENKYANSSRKRVNLDFKSGHFVQSKKKTTPNPFSQRILFDKYYRVLVINDDNQTVECRTCYRVLTESLTRSEILRSHLRV